MTLGRRVGGKFFTKKHIWFGTMIMISFADCEKALSVYEWNNYNLFLNPGFVLSVCANSQVPVIYLLNKI